MIECSYKKNEWVAMYADECGDTQVLPFDTYEQAEKFLSRCYCKIGVMTTRFYNHVIAKQIEKEI